MTDVETYINKFPEPTKSRLQAVRSTIKALDPKLQEGMKWGKIAYSCDGTIMVVIAGYNEHVGLHATASTIKACKDKLKGYTLGAGSVQLENSKPLPTDLIKDIVSYRIGEFKKQGVLWR